MLNSDDLRVSGEYAFLKHIAQQRPNLFALDVGANQGDYAGTIKQLAPNATVYAFEPHPATFARLAQHASTVGYTAIHAACSDTSGEVLLYDRAEGSAAASLGTSHATLNQTTLPGLYGLKTSSLSVNSITLDEFLRKRQIEHVDLLKVDTEGHDYRVLLGAKRAIEEGRIDVIQFEFNEMNVIEKVFLRDFRLLLPGYHLFRILPFGFLPLKDMGVTESEIFAFQNIVALSDQCKLTLA